MLDFTGKTVLITGASGALGTTLAVQFAAAGANVVAASRSRYDEVAEKAAPDGSSIVPVENFAIPRNAAPEEIADFIMFTASDQARFATGSEILADGGFGLGSVA